MKKRLKKFLSPYLNCSSKGAISLFMALLMTPFLEIAMILVETGRYNSAVSILDEAMGVSSVSTLADMDPYLHERWGLLALDQGTNLRDTYQEHLSVNAGILGDTIELQGIDVQGIYPLNENALLHGQLLEYAKLNAPVTLAAELGNITELLEGLERMKDLGALFNLMTSGINALDAGITLVESAGELKKSAKDLQSLSDSYENSFAGFRTAVAGLIAALGVPVPLEADYRDQTGKLDEAGYEAALREREANISSAREKVVQKRERYVEVIGQVIQGMEGYQEDMAACSEAIGKVGTQLANATASAIEFGVQYSEENETLQNISERMEEMENGEYFDPEGETYLKLQKQRADLQQTVAYGNTAHQVQNAMAGGLSVVNEGYQKTFSPYSDAVFGAHMEAFRSLKGRVAAYSENAVRGDSALPSFEVYHSAAVTDYVSAEEIDAYLSEQKTTLFEGAFKTFLDGILAFFESLVKMSTFYNPNFSATIDMDYYNTQLGGLPGADSDEGGVYAIVTSLGELMTTVKDFRENLARMKLLEALKQLKALLTSLVDLLTAIAKFAKDIGNNIWDLFTGYDHLYYSTYTTFNLPCRTDYAAGAVSFEGMTGYELHKGALPQQGLSSSPPVFGELTAAISAIQSHAGGTGDDLTFSGAELEYVLYGSKSEIANQMYVFFALYLLRLLTNAITVPLNPAVQSMAAASTFGYPVVMALVIFLEPLVDTLLLVNGADIPLVKSMVYLTPTGLPELLKELVKLPTLTEAFNKDGLTSSLLSAFGETTDDFNYQQVLNPNEEIREWFPFDYKKHCFLLLLLTVTKEQQLARIKNLIQMETLYHYQKKGKEYTFDLRNSYTHLKATVDFDVQQMLPSLLDFSGTVHRRVQYRGY